MIKKNCKLLIGIILSHDVYNIPTYHIVKEMIHRRHKVELYSFRMEKIHIRMFDEIGIEIHPFEELKSEIIARWDCIYSALAIHILPMKFWDVDKFIFHFTTTPYDEPGGYGDYTFTQRDMNINLITSEPAFERMKVQESNPGEITGNPKYDCTDNEVIEKKQILFVDASHTPDSKQGKMEEATMLLKIAQAFPQYKLLIKPRYFKHEQHISH